MTNPSAKSDGGTTLPKMIAVCSLVLASCHGSVSTSDQDQARSDEIVLQSPTQRAVDHWRDVALGMKAVEVERLLGKPISVLEPERDPHIHGNYISSWIYGYVNFDACTLPLQFEFAIKFDDGVVVQKLDPYAGQISRNGSPMSPRLMCPPAGAKFDHYPRIVDFRWYPASGNDPMSYEIEVGILAGSSWQADSLQSDTLQVSYLAPGANAGRWRVRSKNDLGLSAWSDWRDFRFTQ